MIAARRGWHFGLCCAVIAATTGCADGRQPPEVTAMASVSTGLTFVVGTGEQSCGVTLPNDCTDTNQPLITSTPALLVQVLAFAIDVHEVTNEQYRHCVETGPCSRPAKRSTASVEGYYGTIDGDRVVPAPRYNNHPVVYVHWKQAAEYCGWVGKRLPTETEFERVAGGPAKSVAEKRVYAWGPKGPRNEAGECADRDVNLYACTRQNKPAEVATFADDRVLEDGVAVFDLFGNAAEWAADDAAPLANCDGKQPFSCEACAVCVSETRDPHACQIECGGCTCGGGSPGASAACHKSCEAPVCAVYPDSELPVKRGSAVNSSVWRVVRGGSFAAGSGEDAGRVCEGRSDHRILNRRWDDVDIATGFRCAKSL